MAQTSGNILWSAGHEAGNMGEWTQGDGGGIFNSGTGAASASTAVARSGRYSAELTIRNASGQSQAVRLFRWVESRQHPEAYYSAWYYFPRAYSGMGWWNLFQWKSKLSDSVNDPLWVLNVGNRSSGAMFFYLYDWVNQRSYSQSTADIPVGRWFHLEAYYRQDTGNGGQVTFWQDGAKVLDVGGVRTKRPGDWVQWSLNNYTDRINPATATIYVDDAVISTSRVGGSAPAVARAVELNISGAGPQSAPQYSLGFATLAGMLAGRAGQPLENERHDPVSGDGLQQTSTGLMVWRKADNWTAFTDGNWTWINGPFGLQDRANDQRFNWEAS